MRRGRIRSAPSMSVAKYRTTTLEDSMFEAIKELVEYRQGRIFHIRRSDVSPEMEDFLDLWIALPVKGMVIHAELKSQDREVTAGQRALFEMLAQCPRQVTAIVRPVPRENEISYDDFLAFLNSSEG